MESFEIRGEFIELIKLLKACGMAENGSKAKMMVDSGDVFVNGKPESRKRAKLVPGDTVQTSYGEILIEKGK